MKTRQILHLLLLSVLVSMTASAGKTVKIKLTGSSYEPILMTVGTSGRTEVISNFPYILEVPKQDLPINLKFQSENYLYYDISVPKKPYDTTGHVYLVKINETAMNMRRIMGKPETGSTNQPVMGQTTVDSPIEGIDKNQGVNAAPVTGAKSQYTYALIMSNEKYEMAAPVDNAINDGLAFKEYCLKTLGIPGENIRHGTNMTYGKMRKIIRDVLDLAELHNGEANVILYYAGHGIPDNKTKDAFIMPVDADGTDTDVCISLNDLYNTINKKNINLCVVFLDACFSGAKRDGDMIVAGRSMALVPRKSTPVGKTVVFSASSGEQAAYSYRNENHGLFTYFLLSKLQETKGKIKLGELAEYLTKEVEFESRKINNIVQTPSVLVSPELQGSWQKMKLTK